MKRKYKVIEEIPAANGRTQIVIQCPFCDENFNAYVWSMAACGKKCSSCKAQHHYWSGEAEKNG